MKWHASIRSFKIFESLRESDFLLVNRLKTREKSLIDKFPDSKEAGEAREKLGELETSG